MKNIIFTILFSLILSAEYLVVSSNPIGNIEGNVTRIDNFINSFNAGGSSQTREFPIYMRSDSTDKIHLSISNFANLSNGNDNIGIKIYYKDASSTNFNEIQNNSNILLQGARDGQNSTGSLRIEINGIDNQQTAGNYINNSSIRVSSGDMQSSSSFKVNANAPLVAIARLGTSINSNSTGSGFISSTIDFNKFSFNNINSIEKPLYIRSNSDNKFKITFQTIPDLEREGAGDSCKIAMKYYFNSKEITAGDSFVALTGKNNGSNPIGTMMFQTEKINASHIAGEYSASISVYISAQ